MVRVPNRGSVRFLNLIIDYVDGEIFGIKICKKIPGWSAL